MERITKTTKPIIQTTEWRTTEEQHIITEQKIGNKWVEIDGTEIDENIFSEVSEEENELIQFCEKENITLDEGKSDIQETQENKHITNYSLFLSFNISSVTEEQKNKLVEMGWFFEGQ